MADYKSAIWMPNQNFFPNTGKKSFLILHGTAGGSSAQGIANFFKGTEGTDHPASTHYIVGQDGTVVQTVHEKDGAYGNGVVTSDNWSGNPNFYTISIEHVKSATDNSNQLTEAQKQASFKLVKDICQRNNIGMHDADDTTGITGHFAIDPVSRARCPGPYPWAELWDYLAGKKEEIMPKTIDLTDGTIASHFVGDDKLWRSDNGYIIGHAILDFYRRFGGDNLCGLSYLGLPVSNEIGIPGKPGAVCQRFERAVVCYDPSIPHSIDNPPGAEKDNVYLLHIDSGPGQDPRVAALQAENDKLKALLASSNLGQVATIIQHISGDVDLIKKLVSTQ